MKLNAGRLTSNTWMVGVFIFLYLPILTLIVFSFNASPMVTNWGGLSLRWYIQLFSSPAWINALVVSVQMMVPSSLLATAMGTAAADLPLLVAHPRG